MPERRELAGPILRGTFAGRPRGPGAGAVCSSRDSRGTPLVSAYENGGTARRFQELGRLRVHQMAATAAPTPSAVIPQVVVTTASTR